MLLELHSTVLERTYGSCSNALHRSHHWYIEQRLNNVKSERISCTAERTTTTKWTQGNIEKLKILTIDYRNTSVLCSSVSVQFVPYMYAYNLGGIKNTNWLFQERKQESADLDHTHFNTLYLLRSESLFQISIMLHAHRFCALVSELVTELLCSKKNRPVLVFVFYKSIKYRVNPK